MAKLTFVLEDGQEIVVPLADHITLGREEDNDIVVDDDRVSKRHAEMVRNADGSIQLFDSNSTAGTFVNGERVRSHTIRHGDQLAFGPLTAILDLTDHTTNGIAPVQAPSGGETQALTSNSLVKADRIGPRKKNKGGRRDLPVDTRPVLPADALLAQRQTEHQEAVLRLGTEKTRLQEELGTVQKELREWRDQAEKERAMHHARVEALRAEEDRLSPVKTAILTAQTTHSEWLAAIQALSTQHAEQTAALQHLTTQHAQKAADMQRLRNDEAAARHELETLATHRDQALAHLQQIRVEAERDEIALEDLRRQMADLDARSQHSKEIADVRDDQVKAAEKKLEQLSQRRAQIEAHIQELTGAEEKLTLALADCREAETKHASLTTALASLGQDHERSAASVKDLESRLASLQDTHQQASASAEKALASRQRIQEALAASEKELSNRKAEFIAESQRLEETQTRRAELHRQCQELAETGQKLASVKAQLATIEHQLAAAKTTVATAEAQIAEQKSVIKTLAGDESATKGRIEVLHSRENDLRTELAQLAAGERSQRTRFEEVRQLAAEADKEHTTQQQTLASQLESARNELTALISQLQPLRDWKEAMDLLYARLATLPQDSPEARDLWHEIEKEKAGLLELISTARAQAHADASLRGKSATLPAVKAESPRPARSGGAVASGTAQETTLRSRLSHLRENVQREETRLEQLRLERMRHETPHRTSPAAEAMMREQSRHLETKIRQEQERHHALLRNIELSQAEEDKRRDRLGELEHKLAELRTAITEAERQRSELRQQADLAHTELKNYESAIDRVTKKTPD